MAACVSNIYRKWPYIPTIHSLVLVVKFAPQATGGPQTVVIIT